MASLSNSDLDDFRLEVQRFMDNEYPEAIKSKVRNGTELTKHDYVATQQALHGKGWAGRNWPIEAGGTGWSAQQKIAFLDEFYLADGLEPVGFGLDMVGPIIYTYGSEAQKRRFLPKTLSCEIFWCQGYSEPGSGSDLASLATTAVRQGGKYVVNGQKAWTTMAHWADWIFCLVRTETGCARKQDGISFIVIDLRTPGVSVRPVIMMDGGHEINEVFFENVEVPIDNLIGEEGRGWTYGKVLLQHERTIIARVFLIRRWYDELVRITSRTDTSDSPLIDDPSFSIKLAEVAISLKAHETTWKRTMMNAGAGETAGTTSSVFKIRASELIQRIDELRMEAAAYYGLRYTPCADRSDRPVLETAHDWAAKSPTRYFNFRKDSIYGGSAEIQRNIISKHVLGL